MIALETVKLEVGKDHDGSDETKTNCRKACLVPSNQLGSEAVRPTMKNNIRRIFKKTSKEDARRFILKSLVK